MFFISHRGNINGKNNELENSPDYIQKALELNFDIEIDVWVTDDSQIYLGHDYPEWKIDLVFLKNKKLWCHCKNLKALELLLKNDIHCFFHQSDDHILTSKGYIWSYPKVKTSKINGICVLPEWNKEINPFDSIGICSDNIEYYKNLYYLKNI
jgi:glycerophosphoryl diester phosphodiesterase